jgi:predicted component of type VI protein secretion system
MGNLFGKLATDKNKFSSLKRSMQEVVFAAMEELFNCSNDENVRISDWSNCICEQ